MAPDTRFALLSPPRGSSHAEIDRLQGEWEGDLPNGRGVFALPAGEVYEGSFKVRDRARTRRRAIPPSRVKIVDVAGGENARAGRHAVAARKAD